MAKKKSLEWQNCSEAELREHLRKWVHDEQALLKNTIVFLTGEMGAGKSTFARLLLEILAPGQVSKGSPTFPLVQEYRGQLVRIYHIDLYRLKNEAELEESGILSQIEEPSALVLVEWADKFPESFEYWTEASSRPKNKDVYQVSIKPGSTLETRTFQIQR